MNNLRKLALVLTCGGGLAACQSLDVAYPNAPTLSESLETPTNVETSVGSAFKYWHAQTMDNDVRQGVTAYVTVAIAGNSEEITDMGDIGAFFQNVAEEPHQPMEHHDAGFWTNRLPWANYYTAIATCKDVIETLDAGMRLGTINEQFPNGTNTDRARWLCWFVMGASHAYLASLYDRVLLVSPGVARDLYDTSFVTPRVANDFAITQVQHAIDLATAATDDATPTTWINGQVYTRAEMIQVMHSYLARIRAFAARNATERGDISQTGGTVDWTKVIADVDAGITATFHPVTGSPLGLRGGLCPTTGTACGGAFGVSSSQTVGGTLNGYKRWVVNTNSLRPSQRYVGPGDTTGAYQWWEAQTLSGRRDTIYGSPDRRVMALNSASGNGRYIGRNGTAPPASNLGTQTFTRYTFVRWGTSSNNTYRDSFNITLTRTEMDLLKAEAYIRLGTPALAVPLINNTRVGVSCIPVAPAVTCVPTATPVANWNTLGTWGGNLPPVTVAGPPQTTVAEKASCVPRKPLTVGGVPVCGDLMDALMWEKRLESYGIDMIVDWSDWRAWGKMQPGAWLAMPIHSRELFTLGLQYYTFGGVGIPDNTVGGSNTVYPRCTMTVIPCTP